MALILNLLALVCFLGALVSAVIILIHAFQKSTAQGLLCLCVPCYIIYYAIAEFEHEKKGLILALYFGGSFVGGALQGLAASFSGNLGG